MKNINNLINLIHLKKYAQALSLFEKQACNLSKENKKIIKILLEDLVNVQKGFRKTQELSGKIVEPLKLIEAGNYDRAMSFIDASGEVYELIIYLLEELSEYKRMQSLLLKDIKKVYALENKCKFNEAFNILRSCLKIQPHSKFLLRKMGHICLIKGDYALAAIYFENYINQLEVFGDTDILLKLFLCYGYTNEFKYFDKLYTLLLDKKIIIRFSTYDLLEDCLSYLYDYGFYDQVLKVMDIMKLNDQPLTTRALIKGMVSAESKNDYNYALSLAQAILLLDDEKYKEIVRILIPYFKEMNSNINNLDDSIKNELKKQMYKSFESSEDIFEIIDNSYLTVQEKRNILMLMVKIMREERMFYNSECLLKKVNDIYCSEENKLIRNLR